MQREMILSRIAIYSTRTDSLKKKWNEPFSFAQKVFTFFDRPKKYYNNKPMPFEEIPTHCAALDYTVNSSKPAMFEAIESALISDYKIGKWEFAVAQKYVDPEVEARLKIKLWHQFNGRMYGVFQLPYFITRCFLTMMGLGKVGRKLPNIKRGVICSEIIYWWFWLRALVYEWNDVLDLLNDNYKPDNFHSLDAYNVARYCEDKGYLIFYR